MGDVTCIQESCCCSYSSLYFFSFFPSNFQTLKFLSEFSRKMWGLEGWNFIQTWTVGSCVLYTEIRMLLLIHSFSSSFFFHSSFQILNIFVAFFSGTVRPRRLKLVTHVNNGWMYYVYQNQTAAAYLFLYFSFFLSFQFSNIKNFVALLSGIVSHRKLKLGIHMNNGMDVSCIPKSTAAAYSSLFLFFFLSNFQRLKVFIKLFSWTVRSRY